MCGWLPVEDGGQLPEPLQGGDTELGVRDPRLGLKAEGRDREAVVGQFHLHPLLLPSPCTAGLLRRRSQGNGTSGEEPGGRRDLFEQSYESQLMTHRDGSKPRPRTSRRLTVTVPSTCS